MGHTETVVPPAAETTSPQGTIMADDSDEPRGFRVTDRRRFTEGADESTSDAPTEVEAEPQADEPPFDPIDPDAPVTFSTFILGLSTQALFHLGEIVDPTTGRAEQDLPAAKQVIDILGILSEKTKNNLQEAEQSLLDAILYDLRMRFVELVRRASKEGA
ncbi:MAG TPA: DUF1844 domain-containing protein [Candidatus Binatia bacterium]|jgi:hypothetical protein|nr:DUF1844 domain-containing protein [Candidatus Binatia bacterium]